MRKIKLLTLLLIANFGILSITNAQSEKTKTVPAQTEIKKTATAAPHTQNSKKRIPPTPKNQSAVIHSDQAKEVKKEDERTRSGELHSEPMTSPK